MMRPRWHNEIRDESLTKVRFALGGFTLEAPAGVTLSLALNNFEGKFSG